MLNNNLPTSRHIDRKYRNEVMIGRGDFSEIYHAMHEKVFL